jgi:hypothetical protein
MTPHDVGADLRKLMQGFQVSQAIHVAATLGLADHLASGARTSDELAAATGTHPPALYRLMRALASAGIFREHDQRRFELTPVGELLRGDVAGTEAPMAQLFGRPSYWRAWGDLLHAVRTGNTAFDHVHGCGVWEHRAQHSVEGEVFDRAMAARTEQIAEVALAACDFSRFAHVVDVGGGDGTLLANILAAHPQTRGTLFDQPQTIARARSSLASLGLSTRCQAVGGSFFADVPEDGDAYVLKWILHDWDDRAAADILRACRRAMKADGALIVFERLVGPPNTGSEGKFADLNMLVMNGGRERTRDEFAALFGQSGFRLVSVTPTSTPLCVIEGVLETPTGP